MVHFTQKKIMYKKAMVYRFNMKIVHIKMNYTETTHFPVHTVDHHSSEWTELRSYYEKAHFLPFLENNSNPFVALSVASYLMEDS